MSALPDIIDPDVRLLVCGYNAGPISAEIGHYFSNPAHRFWRTLYDAGLTPELLKPERDTELLKYGIGLTDLMKNSIHGDVTKPSDGDRALLNDLVLQFKPLILVFQGKRPAVCFLGHDAGWGHTGQTIGETQIWTAPDPSPANGRFARLEHVWRLLAEQIR